MLIHDCTKCSRLHLHLKELKKKFPSYHCKPVTGSGKLSSMVCIVGLAPGLHGANKTGVPFTNDFSGILLREVLHEINLNDFFITNAVRCFPKNNKPSANEKNNCQKFTQKELNKLKKLRVIVTLGEIAYKQIIKVYGLSSNVHKFKHGNIIKLNDQLTLISSYHCSKLNINTGKFSRHMLKDIFLKAMKIVNYG